MEGIPRFYGIRDSNLDPAELWDSENFPRTFTVALVNRMGDLGLPVNLIRRGTDACFVDGIEVGELYGCPVNRIPRLRFDFDTVYGPFAEIASGVPESSLVVTDQRGFPLRRLDVQTSVIPDASTAGLPDDLSGAEVTVRTPTLVNCALSMASSLTSRREEALSVLTSDIPPDVDWSSPEEAVANAEAVVTALDILESEMRGLQSPFMLQSVWRSEPDGPFLDENAMDAFVWTDFAFTRLFLDSGRRTRDGKVTRTVRCAVRLYNIIKEILNNGSADVPAILSKTGYGLPGNREFMVNGRQTNRYMACGNLTEPRMGVTDVIGLASEGFEAMIIPDRRLDLSVYSAVRALHG